MKRSLLVLVGCSGPAIAPTVPTSAAAVVPVPPRAAYEVVPAELGDTDVLLRIRHRVRIARYAAFALTRTGKLSATEGKPAVVDVLPVLGETRDRVRVVSEDDHARFTLWIPRTDLRRSALARMELGAGAGDTGVWLDPGALLEIDPDDGRGARRAVAVVDAVVEARGEVAAALVGHVWVTPPGEVPKYVAHDHRAWTAPADPRPRMQLRVGAEIRAAAAGSAAVIARVKADTQAFLVGVVGAFTEIELRRPDLRVRGFVAATDAVASPHLFRSHGSGTGHGFGISHSDSIEVRAGACLFDAIGGDVIGVQLETGVRLGRLNLRGKAEAAGWRMVYVDTDWSTLQLYVHDLADDPKAARWDMCSR